VGFLLAFIATRAVSPPIIRYFDEHTTASVVLAAEIALELTEDGLDTLLSLRLSQEPSMVQTVRADTVQQLRAMIDRFPTVEIAVVELPDTLLMASSIPVEYFAENPVQAAPGAVEMDFDGAALAHWEYFPFYRWVIVTFAPERISHAPLDMLRRAVAISTIGATVGLVVTVILVFQGLVARRLRRLVGAAHRLADGQYPVVGENRSDEIAQVSRAFDKMVQSLREKESAAAAAYRQLASSESRIRTSLHEKEVLLREVHHRVRNNLNIIVSLMHLQTQKFAPDDSVVESLRDVESRVMSMSLVHSMIYESQSLAAIDVKEYLTRLAEEIVSMSTVETEVRLDLDLESVDVELDVGIPLGLLANELLMNSIKHAFPGRSVGTVRVSYHRSAVGDTLLVEDDGVGIPDEAAQNLAPRDSLGLTLIRQLAAQLDAQLSISGREGTRVSVHFDPGA
jgi:two-component sensor histidine kinase